MLFDPSASRFLSRRAYSVLALLAVVIVPLTLVAEGQVDNENVTGLRGRAEGRGRGDTGRRRQSYFESRDGLERRRMQFQSPKATRHTALAYGLASAACNPRSRGLAGLSTKAQRFEELQAVHTEKYEKLILKSLGVKKGEPIDRNIMEIARKQEPWKPAIARLEQEFEQQIRDELTPHQLKLASRFVLRERYRIGGIPAVLASTDIPAVNELDLTLKPPMIIARFDRAIREAQQRIERPNRELSDRSAQLIRQHAIESTLDGIGQDGMTLRKFIAKLD